MQTVHADSVAAQPWRNGGGRTRELLAWPAGPDWRVRVSLADIDSEGPFSAFPGVERWFAVVQGAGVRLAWPDGLQSVRPAEVKPADPPLRFDGAEAPGCTLIDGPTRDLNLMLRRDTGAGTMQPVIAGKAWTARFDQRGLFTFRPGLLTLGEEPVVPSAPAPSRHRIDALTLVWSMGDSRCIFVPDTPGPCGWWLGFSDLAP